MSDRQNDSYSSMVRGDPAKGLGVRERDPIAEEDEHGTERDHDDDDDALRQIEPGEMLHAESIASDEDGRLDAAETMDLERFRRGLATPARHESDHLRGLSPLTSVSQR
jgi:hypothetical protein